MGHDEQIDLPEHHEGAEHEHHGGAAVTGAPERAGIDLVDAAQQVQRGDPAQHQRTVAHHLGLGVEEGGELGGEDHDRHHQHGGHGQGQQQGPAGAAVGPGTVAGAQVLPHEGGGGQGQGLHGQEHDLVDLGVGGPAGHAVGAEVVDIAGDEDVGKGGDGHLQGGGQPHLQDPLQQIHVDGQLPGLQPDAGVIPQQDEEHQQGGHALGDDGGQGHAPHAHVEPQDEEEVQHGIQPGGDNEKVEGAAAVSHGPEDGGAHIVNEQAHDAGEVDGEIGGGLRHDLRRRIHEAQQNGGQGQTDAGEGHAHDQRDEDGGVDGLGDLVVPLGAVILADDHAGAAAQPHEKADEHVDDGRHAAHGGKGLVGHVVAHHPGVHHIVELLKHVARQQGQSKQDQVPRDAACGHIHVVAAGWGPVQSDRQLSVRSE